MAGIGLVSLKYLDADNAYPRQLAAWYDEGLAGCDGIERVPVAPGCESARHLYQVLVDRRDEVMVALNAAQIYPGVHYRDNTLVSRCTPTSRRVRERGARATRVISLPMHLQLDRADVERVCETLKAAVRA